MTAQKKDLFDIISPDSDVFDGIEQEETAIERLKKEMVSTLEKFDTKERKEQNRRLSEEMKDFIRGEIAKIKPVQNVIEKTVETKVMQQVPVHLEPKIVSAPPQIVKEVRVEVPAKDKRDLVEQADLVSLKKEIETLRKEVAEARRRADSPIVMPGGSGVIGIPPPEPHEGLFLKVVNRKATWAAGGGGASISGYTINDPTELKDLPADASPDDIRQVLGTLLREMQA
jgi:hypothetical protein